MSMGNFIPVGVLVPNVMATSEHPSRSSDSTPEAPEPGAGIAHPTVVPTNFDPDAPDGRRD